MKDLLTQRGAIQTNTDSATSEQLTVTTAQSETDVQLRVVPLAAQLMQTAMGPIPVETFQIYVDTLHTVLPGCRIVVDSVTYQVDTVQTFDEHHLCGARKLEST